MNNTEDVRAATEKMVRERAKKDSPMFQRLDENNRPIGKPEPINYGGEVEQTLASRGEVYGNYRENKVMMTIMMELIYEQYMRTHGKEMPNLHKSYMWDIINKIVRLANCPTHGDSWLDLAGYSKLVLTALRDSGEVI